MKMALSIHHFLLTIATNGLKVSNYNTLTRNYNISYNQNKLVEAFMKALNLILNLSTFRTLYVNLRGEKNIHFKLFPI
jgi:hypothetical protein